MMLNTDFGLIYELGLNSEGQAACIPNLNCTIATATNATFQNYATVRLSINY